MRRIVAVVLFWCLAACDKGPPPAQVKAIQKYEAEAKLSKDRVECASRAHKSTAIRHPADAQRILGDATNDCLREKGHRIPGGQK